MAKMTKREVFTAIVEGKITDEVIAEVKGYITKLDETNEKRKNAKTKAQAEVDKVVFKALTETPAKASDIAKATGFSTSKVVASCTRLEAEEKVVITKEAKGSRNISWYALAEGVTNEADEADEVAEGEDA